MQEEIEYEEPQESYEEEDGRSNVADLITVDESSNADAFSLAYIQVSLSRFVIRGHSNNRWHSKGGFATVSPNNTRGSEGVNQSVT